MHHLASIHECHQPTTSRHCLSQHATIVSEEATDKGKGKGLDACYGATYMSQTRDQQHFTISEVAADWHEPIMPHRIM